MHSRLIKLKDKSLVSMIKKKTEDSKKTSVMKWVPISCKKII